MRWFRFGVLVCLATVLQAGFLSNFNTKPDLLIITLVFFAIYFSTTEAIISSFIIGFAADLIGPSMGSQMLSFGILGTILAYLNRVVALRKIPYQVLSIFIMTILAGILSNFLNSLKGIGIIEYGIIIKTTIFSAIAGPFVFIPSAWWMRINLKRYRKRH